MKHIILIAFVLLNKPLFTQNTYDLKYVGNMGIAIIHNDSVILIDALHDFYGIDYLPSDPKVINSILTIQKPFSTVLASIFTHKIQDQTASAKVTAWWGTDYILLENINDKWMIRMVLWQGPLNK
jgi:hypothetical protein